MEEYIIDRINQSRTKSGNYASRTTSSPEAKPKQGKHINTNLKYKHDDNEGETKKRLRANNIGEEEEMLLSNITQMLQAVL